MATARGEIVTAVVAALAGAAGLAPNAPVERTTELPAWEALDDGPVTLVSDPQSTQAQAAYGNHAWPLTVQVEVIAQAGATPETLRGYAQAVLTAVGASTGLAALVTDLRPGAVRINPGNPGDTVASAMVELAITYEAALWGL